MSSNEFKSLITDIKADLEEIKIIVSTNQRPFMPIEEASKYIGVSVSVMRQYINQGRITAYKPTGRRLYFKVSDLDEFILDEAARQE